MPDCHDEPFAAVDEPEDVEEGCKASLGKPRVGLGGVVVLRVQEQGGKRAKTSEWSGGELSCTERAGDDGIPDWRAEEGSMGGAAVKKEVRHDVGEGAGARQFKAVSHGGAGLGTTPGS